VGANVVNIGQHSLAQVGRQNLDLSLLQEQAVPQGPISQEWIERNVQVDQAVEFGSPEYFELAEDPEARLFLQSGRNVLFAHRGQVISVFDPADHGQGEGSSLQAASNAPAKQTGSVRNSPSAGSILEDLADLLDWLARFVR